MALSRTKREGDDAPDLSHFRRRYPLTVASFGALADREAWLRRVWLTESRWRDSLDERSAREVIVRTAPPVALSVAGEFEIVYAGGAAGLLHAAVLACRYGRRVLVLREPQGANDDARVWKVSREEIEGLARAGLFTREEIDASTVSRWRA
jgi:lycopene cyclase CruA